MKLHPVLLTFILLNAFAGYSLAQGSKESLDNQVIVVDNTDPVKAIEAGNKTCPVSKEKVPGYGVKTDMGDKPIKIAYKGRVYNLCCRMCIKDFKKDPEKYSAIAEKEVNGSS
jgi:YHS domain-containing protein